MSVLGNPVNQDFFQRIVNVAFPHEPNCFWWTGNGTNVTWLSVPNFTWFESDDGMEWNGGAGGGADDLSTAGRGMWMRQRFDSRGAPVWLVFGHAKDPGYAQVNASFDGGFTMQRIQLEFDASDIYFTHFMNAVPE